MCSTDEEGRLAVKLYEKWIGPSEPDVSSGQSRRATAFRECRVYDATPHELPLRVMSKIVKAYGIHKHFGHSTSEGRRSGGGERELVFVIGPSGSGKSTLLRCLNRLEQPGSGSIEVAGIDMLSPRTTQPCAPDIGMVFQSFNLYRT